MGDPTQQQSSAESRRREESWPKVLFYLHLNVLMVYGIVLVFTEAYITTVLFSLLLVFLGILGVTAGAHRLWAHQSYKASTRLRVFLMLCQTLVGHGSIYEWVQYHRLHHKHFGTDLDPYNPSKGLVYSQFISVTLKPSPVISKELESIDVSDLKDDKIVMFQKKYYWLLYGILCILLPINAPAEYWGESLKNALVVAGILRIGICIQMSNLIHSATRIWGLQSGEKYPADTNLVFILTKSFWLPYHYLTPWDYQTGEYGKYGTDCVSKFIRVCAALGDATDLRTVDSEGVKEALAMAVDTKKHITQCLLEVEKNSSIPKDHYLQASKYY